MPQEVDRKRVEGVYVSSFVYPPQGGPQSTRLYRIERVNGDASVDRLQVDQDEACAILAALQREMGPQRDSRTGSDSRIDSRTKKN